MLPHHDRKGFARRFSEGTATAHKSKHLVSAVYRGLYVPGPSSYTLEGGGKS